MWFALGAALAAAIADAVGSVFQAEGARREGGDRARGLRMVKDLLRQTHWLIGTGLIVLTFALHTLALALAPLAFVQPVLLLRLPFAVPLAASRRHERIGRQAWIGLALSTVGLILFLVVANPRGGKPLPTPGMWIAILGSLAAVLVVVTLLARWGGRTRRALLLGLCTGTLFASQAVLMRATSALGERGFVQLLTSWQPYLLGAVALSGLLYQQKAYQAGPFAASRPPLDVVQVTFSLIAGVLGFDERIRTASWALLLEAIGLVASLAGITTLSRSPLVERTSKRRDNGSGTSR